jgi:hypothetical protein
VALLVNQAKPANPVTMVLQVPLVPPEMLAPPAVPAKLVPLVLPENPAKTVHLAAANTAHQLVWLQVIKRRRLPSQAIRQIGRPLGRMLDNDKKTTTSFRSGFSLFFNRFYLKYINFF